MAGPHILGYGNFSEEEKQFALNLFSKYSKVKGKVEIEVRINGNIVKAQSIHYSNKRVSNSRIAE